MAAISSAVTVSVNLGFTAGMDFHPATGALYVADGGLGDGTNKLYTLDPTTGALTLVGPTGVPAGLAGLTFAIPEPTTSLLAGVSLMNGIFQGRRRTLAPRFPAPS
jgi:DNA-binding beta-propeller fold protein YncE